MKHVDSNLQQLREALAQQRKIEAEHWPFVGENDEPTGTGESITYHLASLYQWSPDFVLSLPVEQRDERLNEIWISFMLAGDIIRRYEDATEVLLKSEQSSDAKLEQVREDIALLRETMDASIKHLAGHVSHLAQQFSIDHGHKESE